MLDKYLYEKLTEEFGRRTLAEISIPTYLKDNLNPNFKLRPYQVDAFQRFFCYFENNFEFKQRPSHLLFNMATGSGKTLIMAGIILYLYEHGYRNFLFFVNSTNIIEKTKANFLSPLSIKYLFNRDIIINNRHLQLTQVENFEGTNQDDINICFTTIQKLHSDLMSEKENSLTFEDFRKQRIVLIADEAHHMNVKTKALEEIFESWENTVERIFLQNDDNLLLEFTATHDYSTPAMVDKYKAKVIFRYELLEFRNDKFSKDVVIVQSDFNQQDRIIQALILNQYKQEVAAKHRINLKPVILFKAQRTIAQSIENKAEFHRLIDGLTAQQIARIRHSGIPIIHRALQFFNENGISDEQLVERLRYDFQRSNCLSVNEEAEKEQYQILLNSLEDKSNRIRAIFAVQKLNEGWDVLNLFDIVRCYEARDTGRAKIGSTTMSEAQLIGRGARYFPFVLPESSDRFRRKFDGDLENELRVLEELHYHSINDSRYISEIRQALIEQGIMDEVEAIFEVKLKESFKKSDFFNFGVLWLNDRRPKDYSSVKSFSDMGVKQRNYLHHIASGYGGEIVIMDDREKGTVAPSFSRANIGVHVIERNIVQAAIARNPFFTFANLRRFFPNLKSMAEFISSENYLGGLEITLQGNLEALADNKVEKLFAVDGLLAQIESEIRVNISAFEGTRKFRPDLLNSVFKEKTMKFDPRNPLVRFDPDFERLISSKEWVAFENIYCTSEEKALVQMLDNEMQRLQESYEQIYLLRNEGHFAIYSFNNGYAFEPDFVLFLREKGAELAIYQLFVEPKGKHLIEHDKWKEEFLKEIFSEFKDSLLEFRSSRYRIIGVPFYNSENENFFRENLVAALPH